ncbi:MAG: hypothetical protein O7F71_16435 [Gammaproteobacteria bacterium]|nr:hypothetical protein [Gammaproteobacteria bacterium]
MPKRERSPNPEICCDLNARMTDSGYSLERRGSVDDLNALGLSLESAVGRQFVFVMDDADDYGRPDDIMFNGSVAFDEEWGYLAIIDEGSDIYWSSEIERRQEPE